MKEHSTRKVPLKRWHLSAFSFATCMTISERLYAAPTDPWDKAVQVLQTAFTGPIGTGLALVAIVLGGLMLVFGDGPAKRTLADVIFGVGMAVGAVNFISWLFPWLPPHLHLLIDWDVQEPTRAYHPSLQALASSGWLR